MRAARRGWSLWRDSVSFFCAGFGPEYQAVNNPVVNRALSFLSVLQRVQDSPPPITHRHGRGRVSPGLGTWCGKAQVAGRQRGLWVSRGTLSLPNL